MGSCAAWIPLLDDLAGLDAAGPCRRGEATHAGVSRSLRDGHWKPECLDSEALNPYGFLLAAARHPADVPADRHREACGDACRAVAERSLCFRLRAPSEEAAFS